MKRKKEATPTPKYGSFTGMTKSRYEYPYEWPPVIAMGLQTLIGGGVIYAGVYVYDFNILITLGVAGLAGLSIGILYNLLASRKHWQKLHWIDVITAVDPFMLP